MPEIKDILIQILNRSNWWHVPPRDPKAYQKRGKFLASTYSQAAFYGRPNDNSERVTVKNPVFGFSEADILEQLFEKQDLDALLALCVELTNADNPDVYQKRIELDARMYARAKQLKFDAIVLMSGSGKTALSKSRKPSSIELNLIDEEPMAPGI